MNALERSQHGNSIQHNQPKVGYCKQRNSPSIDGLLMRFSARAVLDVRG